MLDYYMTSTFCLLFLVSLQNLIVFLLGARELLAAFTSADFNKWTGVALASSWVALHCLLPVFAWYVRRKNMMLAMRDDRESGDERELERSPL